MKTTSFAEPVQVPSPAAVGWEYVPTFAVALAKALLPCFSQLKVIAVMVLSEEIVTVLFAYKRRPAEYHAGALLPLPFAKLTVIPFCVTSSADDNVKFSAHTVTVEAEHRIATSMTTRSLNELRIFCFIMLLVC